MFERLSFFLVLTHGRLLVDARQCTARPTRPDPTRASMKAAVIAALTLASPAACFVPAVPRADRRIRLSAGLSKTEVDAYVATVKADVDAVAKARAGGGAAAAAGAADVKMEAAANGEASPSTATVSNAKEQLRSLFGRKADPVLACPVSLEPLVTVNRFYGAAGAGMRQCEKFGTTYFSNGAYIDLVPKEASAEPFWQRGLQAVVQTDTFRNPVVAFLYERGWRQVRITVGFQSWLALVPPAAVFRPRQWSATPLRTLASSNSSHETLTFHQTNLGPSTSPMRQGFANAGFPGVRSCGVRNPTTIRCFLGRHSNTTLLSRAHHWHTPPTLTLTCHPTTHDPPSTTHHPPNAIG